MLTPVGICSPIAVPRMHNAHTYTHREALRSAQLAERLALEDEHAAEYAHLETSCKERLDRYNEKAKQLLDTMRTRHGRELFELEDIASNGDGGSVKYRYALYLCVLVQLLRTACSPPSLSSLWRRILRCVDSRKLHDYYCRRRDAETGHKR